MQVEFKCESEDGESGFPGHLKVSVIYTLENESLSIEYKATTDADTVINLTNHSYFNLGGHDSGAIFEHEIQIDADKYLPLDEKNLPLEPTSVAGTPFDLREFQPLVAGLRSTASDKQLALASGYDHCYILNERKACQWASTVRHPWSGRVLKVYTTEPGMQLYTANHIDSFIGKDGVYYGRYPAVCLETQHFPNSPNRPEFPSTFLKACDPFYSKTIYEFTASDED
jgi:aldose 1-epimerase